MENLAEKNIKGLVDHPNEFDRYNDLFDCCWSLSGEDKAAHQGYHERSVRRPFGIGMYRYTAISLW